MKKIFFFLALFCSLVLAQGWNSTVTTTINEPNLDMMDLTANASGIHVLIKRTNGNIVYYNLNSSGVVDANKTATLQISGDFPNIVASNDIVYALYKTGNVIRAKYSTDGGSSWNWNSNLDRATTSNLCNGVNAIFEEGRGVHTVWGTRDSYPDYETYYARLTPDYSWVEYKNVTDYDANEVGGLPTVTFSDNRVHVSYNTGYNPPFNQGIAKTRDKYYTSWQAPQTVVSGSPLSGAENVQVSSSTLYNFYYLFDAGMGQFGYELYFKTRGVGQTQWSSPSFIEDADITAMMEAVTTSDLITHIVYYEEDIGIRHRSSTNWNNYYTVTSDYLYYTNPGFSNTSNDLFVTWKPSTGNYIKYRQYDAVPLAPTNLDWSNTGSPNYHPVISWGPVGEPDVRENTQTGILIERRFYNSNRGVWGNWSLVADTTGEASSWTDKSIRDASGAGPGKVAYRLRAKDIGNNISPYSETIEIVFGTSPEKMNLGRGSFKYTLNQNFPNPFNPTTEISYNIKEDGFVSLKIYDNLGREVKTLVSETQSAGKHNVDFDASDLPSGMYIYTLRSNEYVKTKKMILLK